MKNIKDIGLLPHEILFGGFLLITWVRLVLAAGFFSQGALVYLTFMGVNAALIYWCMLRESGFRWRLRLLFHPVAMNLVYLHMKIAVPAIEPENKDLLLQQMDHWLLGVNLSLEMETWVNPLLTEVMSFCYILFLPYLMFSMFWYYIGNLELLKKFYSGLFSLYAIGFIGYSWLPALGPYLAMADQFTVPLRGWWFTDWNAAAVAAGSNRVDVFPSLHCAVSSFILFFDRTHRTWRYRLYALPAIGLWISTIYLRYHYFVDVLFGFALAALSLWITRQYKMKGAPDGLSPSF